MAILIPSLGPSRSRMTAGERRFAERLQQKLEDDYVCWYDLPVGQRQLRPDFVILNPRRGLLILEVKDWKLGTISRMDKHHALLNCVDGVKQEKNPLRQAEEYTFALVKELERDPLLRHPPDTARSGKLLLPYAYGVVFSNITRAELERTDIGEVIPLQRIVCKDEFTESVEAEALQERFWQMFPYTPREPLSLPQIDRIRGILYPEVCIDFTSGPADQETETDQTAIANIVRVMDLRQEEIARNLGDGHRIIHGVAGSGKTLLLGYRCVQLAPGVQKPVLVLCFNVVLAAKLNAFMRARGIDRKVAVRHFHGWCNEQLQLYQVPRPEFGDNYPERLVQQVVAGVARGQIPAGQYDAVLIDEGHDFEPAWFQLIVKMLNPATDSLLVLYDGAQSIYKKKGGFSFASVGIKAQGRTSILRVNYRNTAEILAFAYEFAREFMQAEDAETPLVQPETAGRRGPRPELLQHPHLKAELNALVECLQSLHAQGMPWQHIGILYRYRSLAEDVYRRLSAAQIPLDWLQQSQRARAFDPHRASVKLLTMHSSKGLEFPVVIIPNAGQLPGRDCDLCAESKLLYVAMTRAFDRLILSYHRDSPLIARLRQVSERQAA